jgi:alkylhydroperoxidase family enzyme
MPRIEPIARDQADPLAQQIWDQQIATHGRMTNMKRTLARSGAALSAYMQWYPLRDQIAPFLGERLTHLFAHAISTETDCLICGTFFRRILIDAGENPDDLSLDPREECVVAFGRQVARDAWGVNEKLFEQLRGFFSDDQILKLTAFAGLMVATNIINNTLHVELDDYLHAYRSKESQTDGHGT